VTVAAAPASKPEASKKSLIDKSTMPEWLIEAFKFLEPLSDSPKWRKLLQSLVNFECEMGFPRGVSILLVLIVI